MSKTTDEMVMDLLTREFTLPDDMVRTDEHWCMRCKDGVCRTMPAAFAHAIIAMHFADLQSSMGGDDFEFTAWQWDVFKTCMGLGLATDAIKALWEATL
jgi:hypothetical protein